MPARILVVDDDTGFRTVMTRLFTELGLTVVGNVGTVAAALAANERLRPDAVLVDVNLPDGNGLALSYRLRQAPVAPLVVLTSSDPEAVSPSQARRAGAVAFLPKEELGGFALWETLAR